MPLGRCALCPGVNKCIEPDGPEHATILCIGEAPGKNENERGRVFIGKAGEEVDGHYLPLAGLKRRDVMITNAIRCLPTGAGGKLNSSSKKDLALLQSCAAYHLYPLIERGSFKLLVPMGGFACRAVFPEMDLELRHGIPQETPWGIPAFPMYHPALGIHEPKKMLYIRTDWQRLKQYITGSLQVPVDEFPEPDYREVDDESEIRDLDCSSPLAGDTESIRGGGAFCFTYSQEAGRGRLIRAGRVDLLEALQAKLQQWEAPILFHNWPYDWAVTEEMGLQFPYRRIVDTQSLVFHLGNLPQGLKALAYRLCGMTMQDFDDLVTPYSRERVLAYYRRAQDVPWERPPVQWIPNEQGELEKYQPQSMSTKLKRFFTDLANTEEKDVFGMWEKNWVEEQGQLEEHVGEWPGKCISHVPFEETLFYACRDADALIRAYPIIRGMRRYVRKFSQEHWRDKCRPSI